MTTPINSFQDILGAMERDLKRLVKADYEGKAARFACRLARRKLGLVNPDVVMMAGLDYPMSPLPQVDRAAEEGNITWDDAIYLAIADAIVSGTGQDGKQVYVVMEISITVQEKDKTKALRRAELLERATGVTTIPVVIGESEEAPANDSGMVFWHFDPEA